MEDKILSVDYSRIDDLDPRKYIVIKKARVNNLKNLTVAIPRNQFVVITGLSGSGKSSLAFDTLFAEGQRMYVESLSSYARQFLGRMEKPEVDYIRGVSPAIAIEQNVSSRNPRSTVGTTTEIYDYLKLLYARVGETFSPVSGVKVRKDSVSDVVDKIMTFEEGTRFTVLCPLVIKNNRKIKEELNILLSKGFSRISAQGKVSFIEDFQGEKIGADAIYVVIDRVVLTKNDEDLQFRIADSVQTAFFEGHGDCIIELERAERLHFSDRFEADGMAFEEPSVNFFSFNNPYGACRKCEGFGKILGIDPNLVIPDKSLSVYEGAIVPWRSDSFADWRNELVRYADKFDFPIHRAIRDLDAEQYEVLWDGNQYFSGLHKFFHYLETKTHKIQYRVMLSRYRGRTVCPDCKGSRLRKDASYVKIAGKSLTGLVLMPISEVAGFFNELQLSEHQQQVSRKLLIEIGNRLEYVEKVGLGYLTLNRLTASLSGGEFQRIKLATSLGSALVGSMYILDEPSIGLHPRDTSRLIDVLKSLRNLGNSVIVVEHEEEIMKAADQIIDIGPAAGSHGGELVFQGTMEEIRKSDATYTARYLSGKEKIEIPARRRKGKYHVKIQGARENNLKNIDVSIPLGCFTVVTGVSGSGKSTLVKNILYPSIGKILATVTETTGKFDRLDGDYHKITSVEYVDQNPIGKSSRSNPVTYVKAYDAIRQLFADHPLSKSRGYKPAFFSFNVEGGRCENCQGEGRVRIEMQFMADIYLTCENCNGRRFKNDILEVKYNGKDISEVLELTVDDAIDFFKDNKGIVARLQPLQDVGLGYIRLGQASNTLSGGEAQRVKLASYLVKDGVSKNEHILFIFDEPTTGLHFHDIHKLLTSINALVEKGNTVVVIEHNMDMVKCADWIIDLGPEGGDRGGQVTFQGTPEEMIQLDSNYTAKYLKEKFV